MKRLKNSFILVLMVLTVIISSWTFAPNLFTADAKVIKVGEQNDVSLGTGSNPAKNSKPLTANPSTPNPVGSEATNIILQSTDGGQTWEDVSYSLPDKQLPESFFAGESDLYLRVMDGMYRSKSALNTPLWEKVKGLDPKTNSIAFNPSGVMAYSYDGHIYQKKSSSETWLPIFTELKSHSLQTIFEASDGTLFLSTGKSLSKSADKARTWKVVQNGGVGDIVESEGVLVATGQQGIMRSTDGGEHWEWVISEGGVGIDAERIEGGFAAITFNTTTQSRRIRISMDAGKTWQAIDAGLPPSMNITSIKQIGNYLICSHPDGIFRSSNNGKNWTMVNAGAEPKKIKISTVWDAKPEPDNRKVFTLFVSGNVVYAVAREGGC
jgi:photosystem II stability/assembly factor-like uncharacterized protein